MKNPEKEFIDNIHNQMVENLNRSIKVPYMPTKNIQNVVAEMVEEFEHKLYHNDSDFFYGNGAYNNPAMIEWLTTTLTQLVEAAREEERERIVDICWRHFGKECKETPYPPAHRTPPERPKIGS